MAFDAIARALLTGSVGYLQGKRRREEEAREREQEASEAALAAAKAKREAQMDEVRARFVESQTRANDALAHSRMHPEPPAPKVSIRAGSDGTLYRVDETTGKATPITRADGTPVRQRVPTVGAPSASQPSPAQTSREAAEDAEGVAIMRTYGTAGGSLTHEQRQQFWHAWSYAKRANPTLSDGRLAVMVLRGLQRADPNLRPRLDGAASTTDRLEAMALGGAPGHVDMQTAPGLRSGSQPSPLVSDEEDVEDAPPLTAAEIQQFRGLVALSPDPRQALLDAGLTPEEVAQVLP